MKIKTRLTLLNAIVVVLIQSVVSLSIYGIMRQRLHTAVREKLDRGYNTVAEVLWNSGGDVYDIYHFGQSHVFCLFGKEKVAFVSKGWTDAALPDAFSDDQWGSFEFGSSRGRVFWLKRGKIPDYDFVLVYAQDASDLEGNLRSLGLISLAAIPCVLLLALLAGWFLARRALAPVAQLTGSARNITADSLSQRLPVVNPNDEIGQLADVINAMLDRIDHAFARLKQFTSDASHELRTPLTALRSVGEVALKDATMPDEKDEAISSMLEETQRLTQLVDHLLTLARHDRDGNRVKAERFDLVELTRSVIAELSVLAEERHQTLTVEAAESAPVLAAQASTRQALANVVHNAVIYTPESGTIEVRVTTDADAATVEVHDSGPGIAKDRRERVFERFYRIDDARTRTHGGTGLGLSIARRAVTAAGGTIAFVDTPMGGICCRIRLPKPRRPT